MQPATRAYVDTTRWEAIVDEISIASVARSLLDGRIDSGITATEYASLHPDHLRVDEVIGTPDDAWIVYGRERTTGGALLAWRDSPAGRRYRALADERRRGPAPPR